MNIHRKKINKFYEYNDSDLLKQFNSLKDQQELMIPKGQQEADLDTLLKQGLRTYPALTTHLTPVVCHDLLLLQLSLNTWHKQLKGEMGLLSSSFQGVSVRQGSQLYLEEHHCPWWWHRALQLKAEYRNRTGSRARPHSLKDWSLRENLCQLGPASCKLHNLLSVTTCDQVLKSISL